MTRSTPSPAPLSARIRAALATGWHSLSALDVLAGGAASTRRARVHAALAELAAAGMAREERTRAGGVEVREGAPTAADVLAELGTVLTGDAARAAVGLPAPVPDDGHGWPQPAPDEPLSPAEEERSLELRMADECTPAELDELRALEAMEEAARNARLQQEAAPAEEPRAPAAPTPGPSARCAVCDAPFARHATADHPFAPKRRGAPPGPRQRRPVDVASEARIERAGGPRLAPVGAERRMREGAAPAPQLCGECWVRHTPGTNTLCSGWRAFTEQDAAAARAKGYRVTDDDPPDLRMGASETKASPNPSRYRFWSPSRGMGWLTWGEEVCPSTPTRFEPDDGAPAIEWIWTECGCGKPGEKMPRAGAKHDEWMSWQWFKTEANEVLVFRRECPPAPPLDTRPAPSEAEHSVATAVAAAAPQPAGGRCAPPECHYDRINDPARVPLDGLPPLCAAHLGWVEAARRGAVEGVRRGDE